MKNLKVICAGICRLVAILAITLMFSTAESTASSGFTLNKVYPRIFTPNNDGLNDLVIFYFTNPQDSVVSCRIFDVVGREMANLSWDGWNDFLTWDGHNDQGDVVSSGVYIYQIDVEGKTMSGVVVVAR